MAFDPISLIRTRSREQWQQWAADLYSNLRGWVQQNGEKASLVAFAMGIALVMFYKFIIGLFALGVIAAFVGWNLALPESAAPGSSTDESGD